MIASTYFHYPTPFKAARFVTLHNVIFLLLSLTQLFQHFIALIKHKVFDVLQAEGLVVDQGQGTSRSSNHNVRAVLLKDFFILLYSQATKEHGHLDTWHVLGEALILFADLEGQLPSVAHDKNRHLGEKKILLLFILPCII